MEEILLKRAKIPLTFIVLLTSLWISAVFTLCAATENVVADDPVTLALSKNSLISGKSTFTVDASKHSSVKKHRHDHNSGSRKNSSPAKTKLIENSEFAGLITEGTAETRSQKPSGTIYFAASEFLDNIRNDDMLARFRKREKAHSQWLDFVNTHTFMKHVLSRLEKYRALFEQVGAEYDLDWRLLAAIAYQESHWDPQAVSPTGVRGLMMLTRVTAKQLGISDRLDPEQSVRGGAQYFKIVKKKIPKRIHELDRTWLALASYNVGFGHLEDARILTQKLGGNPDKWEHVKKRLPLLSIDKWHSKTKYGYARGHEPVTYVRNIRSYYTLLKWLTRQETQYKSARADTNGGLAESL